MQLGKAGGGSEASGRQEALLLLLALALVLLATINAAVVWPLATKALQCGKSGGFCAASSLPRSACARVCAPTRHALPSICWSSPTPAMDTSIDVGCAGCGVTATAAQAVIEGTSRNVVRFSCSSTCSSYTAGSGSGSGSGAGSGSLPVVAICLSRCRSLIWREFINCVNGARF